MNSSFDLDPNIEPPIPSHIDESDDNSSVPNLSIPTQLPIKPPNKVDDFLKQFRIQSTQQDGESLSSPEQGISFKNTKHKTLQDKDTNTLYLLLNFKCRVWVSGGLGFIMCRQLYLEYICPMFFLSIFYISYSFVYL